MRSRISSALGVLLLTLWATSAQAAIAFDAKSNNGCSTNDGTASTWSHTTSSGSNRLMVIVVAGNVGTVPPSSVTASYNSVSLTQDILYTSSNEEFVWIGHLVNPASGTNTVSVTATSGSFWDGGWCGFAGTFTGVDATTPLDGVTPVGAAGNSVTSISLNITPTTNNAWIVDGLSSFSAGTDPVQNSPQVLGAVLAAPTWSFDQGWSYNGPVANSSQSDGWTGPSSRYRLAAIVLRPAAGGAACTPTMMLLGVGQCGP